MASQEAQELLLDALLSDSEDGASPAAGLLSSTEGAAISTKVTAETADSAIPEGYEDLLSSGALLKKVLTAGKADTRPKKGDTVAITYSVVIDGRVAEEDQREAFCLQEG
jgi:hypothetical protein